MHEILVYVGGGLGDQVCAEPALRYALRQFAGEMNISLLAHNPPLFSHLKFKDVFAVNGPPVDVKKYIMRGTYPLTKEGATEQDDPMLSFCSVHTNSVDYCALQFLKWQLPFKDREIQLVGIEPKRKDPRYPDPAIALQHDSVIVHPGMTWDSRTFPISWWKEVIEGISRLGATPVIIGQNTDNNGVYKIQGTSAVDLTNLLNIKELIYVLQRCRVIVTNDSLPVHIAASSEPDGAAGESWIGMLATARHPDFLSHYRKGVLGYKTENLSKGGIWSKTGSIFDAKTCTEAEMKSWLPMPSVVARWAVLKGRE